VVFVSCVLEYVGDLPAALREIQRIAGDLENIYIVTVQPWTLTASLYPGAQWAGIADKHVVAMARVTTTHKAIAAGVLAGASLLALWPARRKEEDPMTDARTIARLGLSGVAVAETAATWTRWEHRRRLFLAADERPAVSAGRCSSCCRARRAGSIARCASTSTERATATSSTPATRP
jgi:hypothetical protein